MALQKNYNLEVSYTNEQATRFGLNTEVKNNVNIENAYHKIINVQGDKNNIDIMLGIYNNKEDLNIINQKNYSFIPSVEDTASNFIKQGYEYLKTLPEYADAVDC